MRGVGCWFAAGCCIGSAAGWPALAAEDVDAATPNDATGPPPIAAFTDPDDFGAVEISPTGEYLALTMRHEDGATFRVLDRESGDIVINRNFDENREIADLQWAADHHLLVAPAFRGMVLAGLGSTGEIMVVPIKTGRAGRLGWGQVLDTMPDDPEHVLFYLAEDRFGEVYKVNLNARFRRAGSSVSRNRVARGAAPRGSFVPTHDGGIAFSTGESMDNKTEVYFREGKESWQLVESHGYGDPGWTPLWYSGAAGKYLVSDRRGGGTAGVGLYDAKTNTHEKTFVRHPTVDFTAIERDFRNRIWGVRFDHHYPDTVYLQPDHPLAKKHAMLRKAYPEHTIEFTSTTRDYNLSVAEISSDRKPGDFVLVNVKGKSIEPIASRRPKLQPEMLSPVQPMELNVRDGTTVYGYVTSHPDAERPGPMVVLVHGGPHQVRDFWGFDWQAQLLASRGYHVLQVNFRGSAGYGLSYLSAGFGEWGGRMQDDVTDATRWAVAQKIADPKRICIFGGSYGAYSALMGAVREPELYRCAVGLSGVYDLEAMDRYGDIRTRRAGLHYLNEVLGTPAKRRARSPVHRTGRIRAAVMLIHGALDRRAPLEHAKRLHDALQDAGRDVEWHVEHNQGHGIFGRDERRNAYSAILAFLDKHLASRTPR